MKKLMILAACVLCAAVTQAASVGWSCAGATNFKGGSYSLFVIGQNGVTGADQIKAIVAAGGLSKADSYALYKGGEVNSSGAASLTADVSGASITWTGPDPEVYTAFIVVQDSAGTKASFTATKTVTLENNSTSKSWNFTNQATAFGNNSFTVNTPEPTSGVLLLLGMAGLALKRKRA